jgi:hypothetical protein
MLPVVFLGYAFKWPAIRDAVTAAADGIATVICADDTLTGMHLLDKIHDMMFQADLCLFDLTGHNVNVATEYGIARGLRLDPLILYNESEQFKPVEHVHDVFSDLRGIDSVRYKTLDELTATLRARLPDTIAARAYRKEQGLKLAAAVEDERRREWQPYCRATAQIITPDEARKLGKSTSAFQIHVRVSNEGRGVAERVRISWEAAASAAGGAVDVGPVGASGSADAFIMTGWTYSQPPEGRVPNAITVQYAGDSWSGEIDVRLRAGSNPPQWAAVEQQPPGRDKAS